MKRSFNWSLFLSGNAIIVYLVTAKIMFHLLHPEYGYFRDELYYVTVSDGFNFGNLDILPLTPLFIKLITSVFGYSIKALHFASGLLGALSLFLACLMTRELGGKRYAILLTGLFMMFSGFLIFGAIFTYDSLDFLIWVLAIYLLVKILRGSSPKLWILFGFVLGFGLLNKLSILFFGLALFVSLWIVPQRSYFKRKWIWLAGAIALLFALPFVLWQSRNDWYFLGFAATYSGGIAYVASLPEFLWSQILPNNIFGFPVWAAGLGLLLFSSRWKQYRVFGLMYVLIFLLFYLLGVKFYFLIPMYAILFAVGSVKIEEFFDTRDMRKRRWKLVRTGLPIAYVLLSMPLLPMIVPVLPVDQFVDYAAFLGVDAGVRHENLTINELPQHMADRFGWEEMVRQVVDVYDSVTSEREGDVGILTGNYGEAAALHLLGKKYGLPEPISLHGWFYYDALRTHEFRDRYVTIGLSRHRLENVFEGVDKCGMFTHPYCIPHENDNPIYFCSEPRSDLKRYWRVARQIDPRFLEVLENESVGAAVDYFHELKRNNPSILLFTESQINALGYEYLFDGKLEEAIALFRLNVEVFPHSSNVYDSLGEAYMENGQCELAIRNYKKSLELNPRNSNAVEKLEELEELKNRNAGTDCK
jgi:hypothetical protein